MIKHDDQNLTKTESEIKTIFAEINQYQTELELLNSLIESTEIEKDFLILVEAHPTVIPLIPRLLAVKEPQIKIYDHQKIITYDFQKNRNGSDYLVFMRRTGLFDFLENKRITNLIDYLKGIEMALNNISKK